MAYFSRSSQPTRDADTLSPDTALAPNALIGLRKS